MKSALLLLSVVHLFLILFLISISFYLIAKGRHSLLAFTVLGFAFFDSLGLVIAPYLPLESIKYLPSPIFIITEKDLLVYSRQIISHWIFIGLAIIGLLIEMRWPKNNYFRFLPSSKRLVFWGIILAFIGTVTYVRYFMFGPGSEILLSSRLFFESTVEAIASRSEIRDTLQLGQGAWMASISSTIIFPVAAFFFLKSSLRYRIIVFVILAFSSGVYAFQTRQKAPLLAIILVYGLLWILNRVDTKKIDIKTIIRKFVVPAFFISFVGGAILYMINFGLTPLIAIQSVLARLLIIPGATETNYFMVFPDYFNFRGLNQIFDIGLRHAQFASDVTIYDVAYAATGVRFSSNASFLAVAWSGAGYLGVALISLFLVISLFIIDRYLRKMEPAVFWGVLAISSGPILSLVSGSFLSFVGRGGIVIPAMIIYIYWSSRLVIKK